MHSILSMEKACLVEIFVSGELFFTFPYTLILVWLIEQLRVSTRVSDLTEAKTKAKLALRERRTNVARSLTPAGANTGNKIASSIPN